VNHDEEIALMLLIELERIIFATMLLAHGNESTSQAVTNSA
jgi:hypothetical protein